jgi:UDP-N-acetylmuramate--alanine ligase
MKRAEVLGLIFSNNKGIAISGTHGKTTTSTLLAHILKQSSVGCTAFLGGISKNFNSNLLLNENSEFVLAEADEYDRSFLQLFPYLSIITSVDADHLDVYGTHEEVIKSFMAFLYIKKAFRLMLAVLTM